MLICAQFPFADVRPFLLGESRCIPSPAFFVRRAGQEEPRRGGGLGEWPAEDEFWSARNTLRYEKSLDRRRFGKVEPGGFGGAFRRLFWEESVLPRGRFELGITNTGGGRDRRRFIRGSVPDFDADGGRLVLRDFLRMPVRIASNGRLGEHRMGDAATSLSRLVLDSTTRWKDAGDFEPSPWWVRPGRPMCIVEYGYAEQGEPPPGATPVAEEPAFALHFLREGIGSDVWPVWFLGIADVLSPDTRLIRLHLLRLHAEAEIFRAVLELLASPATAEAFCASGLRSRLLDLYLQKAVGLLSHSAHYGQQTSELLSAAYGYREEVSSDARARVELLVEQAAAVRPVLEPLRDPDHPAREKMDKTYFP
ncbi:MAG TPA: hypothetical protein VFY75_01980 [Solirubrobacterales bacterium]|nr:hypothetical protein [Solirubrobacterales bacterium]